jgi:hypothetical protein
MKLPDFESPFGDSSSKSANFGLSKWIFYVKNHPNLCRKNFIEEYQFNDAQFLTNCHWMEIQNLVISFDYGWFLAKNLAFYDPYSLLGEK